MRKVTIAFYQSFIQEVAGLNANITGSVIVARLAVQSDNSTVIIFHDNTGCASWLFYWSNSVSVITHEKCPFRFLTHSATCSR